MLLSIVLIGVQALLAFFIGTVIFDLIHYLLHCCFHAKQPWLKRLGALHMAHHRFYSPDLKVKTQFARQNMTQHLVVECVFQSLGILFCLCFFPWPAVLLALFIQGVIFTCVLWQRGQDSRHVTYEKLPRHRGGPLVCAYYHALHHVYPRRYFSSYVKVLDVVLGTAYQLRGKRVVMTGASGALGSQMKCLLENEGASVTALKYGSDYTYDDYSKLATPLSTADILLLCHGTKYEQTQQANCDSFVAIIELFKQVAKPRLLPLEIWGVGSEIECHPCFGIKQLYPYAASKRAFARHARQYYHARDIQYRHLVHSAFWSPMGPGLMSARFAARVTMFLLKRGCKYIPVTYTGFALLNYIRFVCMY